MDSNTLTIVVPCFNEEEVLPETNKELGQILTKLIQEKKSVPKVKFSTSMMAVKTGHGK